MSSFCWEFLDFGRLSLEKTTGSASKMMSGFI